MTGASGAPYAVRLLQVLGRLDRTIHLTVSTSAVQVLREEMGLEVSLESFNPGVLRRSRRRGGWSTTITRISTPRSRADRFRPAAWSSFRAA